MLSATSIRPSAAPRVTLSRRAACVYRSPAAVRRRGMLRVSAQEGNGTGKPDVAIRYEHILLAILDSNPHLSTASRTALATAAGLAAQNNSKLTVCFVDELGKKLNGERLTGIQGQLRSFGLENFEFVEEEIEPSVGKGSVAVGDVADQVQADLVVMSSDAIHAKHVDGNLLVEFVPCPVLLLP